MVSESIRRAIERAGRPPRKGEFGYSDPERIREVIEREAAGEKTEDIIQSFTEEGLRKQRITRSSTGMGGGGVGGSSTPAPGSAGQDVLAQQRAEEQSRAEADKLARLEAEAERQRVEEGRIKAVTLIEINRLKGRELQREAGVFGKDIPEAVALSRIAKFQREKERKALIEEEKEIRKQEPKLVKLQQPKDLRVGGPLTIPPHIVEKGVDLFFGESGKKRVGIGVPDTKFFVSFQEIKTMLQRGKIGGPTLKVLPPVFTPIVKKYPSLPGKVVGEFIPTTPGELIILGATAATVPALPKVARIGTGVVVTASQTERALDPSLPAEKRIAAGIIGVGVGTGTAFELAPYVKGQLVKLSPKYKAVKVQEAGFEAVAITDEPIGLIQPGSPAKTGVTKGVKLPKTSPLKRGGFGVRAYEKKLFIGKNQRVATSQISFFQEGKDIKLTREFFVSPQEPTLKIAEARVSRLGLTTLSEVPKTTTIGFGPPGQAQIGVESGASVTRAGVGTAYKLGTGTELEAIKGAGTTITNIQKTGVTTIKGQAVQLFKFKTGPSPPGTSITAPSTQPTAKVSGEIVLGTSALATQVSPKTTPSTQFIPPTIKTTIKKPSIKPITKISPVIRGTSITTPIKRITTPIKVTIAKSITSPPKTPPVSPPPTIITPPRRPPIIPSSPPTRISRVTSQPKSRKQTGRFITSVRRFGKFKPIAVSPTGRRAFEIGRKRVGGTLAASFKITGPGFRERLPTGFRRSKKERGVFIEKRGLRLSTRPERVEIKTYKRRKSGKKKK